MRRHLVIAAPLAAMTLAASLVLSATAVAASGVSGQALQRCDSGFWSITQAA